MHSKKHLRSRYGTTSPFLTISLEPPWMDEERPAPYVFVIQITALFYYTGHGHMAKK